MAPARRIVALKVVRPKAAARPVRKPNPIRRLTRAMASAPLRRITDAPRAARPGKNGAPRTVSLSPLSQALVPVPRTIADALSIHGVIRKEAIVTTRTMWIVTNGGISGTVMMRLSTTLLDREVFTIPLLSASGTVGGATSLRSMKAGISIENVTSDLERGGRVYILNADARVWMPAAVGTMTSAQLDTFFNDIVEHPDSKPYSGHDFKRTRHFHCHIAESGAYESFMSNVGPRDSTQFMGHVATWPSATDQHRPMSCLFVVMEAPPSTKPQDYTISAQAQFYTRWPLDHLGGSIARPIPVASMAALDAIARKAKHESDKGIP